MRLFVYGSLLSGEPNHPMLGDARAIGPARTAAAYRLLDLGPYPALVDGGSTAVHGELYELAPGALADLDDFEGHPHLFRRTPIVLEGDQRAEAYVFAAAPRAHGGAPVVVAGGDWRRHRTERMEPTR